MSPSRESLLRWVRLGHRKDDPSGTEEGCLWSWKSFFIAKKEAAFLREDVISFSMEDTDPGNLTTLQKQSRCFSILLCFTCFISTPLLFSKLPNQLQILKEGENSFYPCAAPFADFTNYKLHTGHWEEAKVKSYLQREPFQLSLLRDAKNWWDMCMGMGREIMRQVEPEWAQPERELWWIDKNWSHNAAHNSKGKSWQDTLTVSVS